MSFQNASLKFFHVGLISAAEDVIAVLKSKLQVQIIKTEYMAARTLREKDENRETNHDLKSYLKLLDHNTIEHHNADFYMGE